MQTVTGRPSPWDDPEVQQYTKLLTPAELKQFSVLKPWTFLAAAGIEIATIVAAIVISEMFWNPFVYILAVIVIGSRIHGLAVLMHDVSHYRALPNRFWNDLVGEIISLPSPLSMNGYRNNHSAHHRELNTDKDPDWVRTRSSEFDFPKTKKEILSLLAQYGFALKTVKDIKQLGKEKHLSDIPLWVKLFRNGTYAALILASIVFGFWKLLILYWAIPVATAFAFCIYVRAVAEHYCNLEYTNILNHTRTVIAPAWERWLLAPHGINYHIEHHLFPSIPYYRLHEVHRYFMTKPLYQQHAHVTYGYHTGLFREAMKPAS